MCLPQLPQQLHAANFKATYRPQQLSRFDAGQHLWAAMQPPAAPWTSMPPPPPPRFGRHAAAYGCICRAPLALQAKESCNLRLLQQHPTQQRRSSSNHQCWQQLAAKKEYKKQQKKQQKKHRRAAAQKKRRAAAAELQLANQQQKLPCSVPESPICPPAPLNDNEYYMERFEQQYAAQQAEAAAVAKLAEEAAAAMAEVAEWDPVLQQASCLQPSSTAAPALHSTDEELLPESPVCPPAPLLDNEFYMSRFEQQLEQQAAAAALAVPPVVDAGVAEWDPLLQEVTRYMDSTAAASPAMAALADDTCSQC